jgi:hypothetical protein
MFMFSEQSTQLARAETVPECRRLSPGMGVRQLDVPSMKSSTGLFPPYPQHRNRLKRLDYISLAGSQAKVGF